MGQVAVTLNGRSYRFDCGDGEGEARVEAPRTALIEVRYLGLGERHPPQGRPHHAEAG